MILRDFIVIMLGYAFFFGLGYMLASWWYKE